MNFNKIAQENCILEIKVGSDLFGTRTPDSDLDLLGIFMPCEEIVYGFHRCEEVDLGKVDKDETGRNTADAIDRKFHEYRKFVRLALQNNPNILHVLFVNDQNIVYTNDFGKNLLVKAKLFPHKGAYHRFVRYADSQRHKMRIKPENYARLEEGLIALEGVDDNKVMGELKNIPPFVYGGKGKHIKLGDLNLGIGIFVNKARRMIETRISKATNRVQLFTKYGFDVKFGSNLIQLLMEGIELMETGKIIMPLAYRNEIVDVKQGKYTAEQIMNWADDLVERARQAYEKSDLPIEPRTKEIEEFAMEQVKEFLVNGYKE